jgi:hypothetical protein
VTEEASTHVLIYTVRHIVHGSERCLDWPGTVQALTMMSGLLQRVEPKPHSGDAEL